MKRTLLALTTVSVLFSSCATIFTGTKDTIHFKTTPSGATIYKDGIEQCVTPCSLSLKRTIGDRDMEIKLDGYETRLITLDNEFNIISVLNLGNLIGWGVDALSGALMKYDTKAYDLTLSQDNRTSHIETDKINIDTKKNIVEVYVVVQ